MVCCTMGRTARGNERGTRVCKPAFKRKLILNFLNEEGKLLFTIGTCSAILRQPTLQPKRRQRRTTKSWKKKKRNDVIFGLCFPLNCIQPLTTARRDMPEREKGGENINKKGGMWYASTGRFLRSLSCRTNGPGQFIPGPNRSAT